MKRLRILFILAVTALAVVPGAADAAAATERVSVGSGGQGNGDTVLDPFCGCGTAISADGRYVAFVSRSTNIHPDDTDTVADIYVRDRQTNTTTLVSRATGTGAKGTQDSLRPSISGDGRYVAFDSTANNLHPDDSDTFFDVYVRDVQANTTTLVSRATGPSGVKGNFTSFGPAVSADGRNVAFASQAFNLHPDDPDANADIFVRDLQASTTTLVSRATGPAGTKGNNNSEFPAISSDGHFVAFESIASTLHPDDLDGTRDVFRRDLQTNVTTLISRATGASGVKGNAGSLNAAVSGDGRLVAYHSTANNLHVDDISTGESVFVRDAQANTTILVSRATGASGGNGGGANKSPSISADGRFVAFQSSTTNFHPDDVDTVDDVYVRDLQTNTTLLVSRSSSGLKGNASSVVPDISAGALVAFGSDGTNLVPGDTNGARDVFVFTDFEFDGMANDYELVNPCLNVLVADAASDPDFDGLASGNESGLGTSACDSDTDNDARSDSVDSCPLIAEDFDGFQDNDGCPETDNDSDGITDTLDTGKTAFFPPGHSHTNPTIDCRNIAEDYDSFKDTDGCPEPDNDNDAKPDSNDTCPGNDNVMGADGALGVGGDNNHNGLVDGSETWAPLGTSGNDDSVRTYEDYDGILDTDGCHDSPCDDVDGDSFGTTIGPCMLFADEREAQLGTNSVRACADTPTPNDEAVDPYPLDTNDDGFTDISDIVSITGRFGEAQITSNVRYELNLDGFIDISDIVLMTGRFGLACVAPGPMG